MKSLESHIITVLFCFLILGTFCTNFQADSFSSFLFYLLIYKYIID